MGTGWRDAIVEGPMYFGAERDRCRAEAAKRFAAAIDILATVQSQRLPIGRAIWQAAREYQGWRGRSEGAPRISTVKKELAQLERACREAANAIDALSDPALNLWHSGSISDGNVLGHDREHRKLYESALGVGFPQWAGFVYPDLDDPNDTCGAAYPGGGCLVFLAPRLRMTADLAAELQEKVRENLGEDRGGRGDLSQHRVGPPAWHLAVLCYGIFRDWRGEPTSAEGGSFYQLVAAVHEFTTGEEGESLPGLRDRVRDAVSVCGERWLLIEKMPKYFGDPEASITDEEMERFRQLDKALVSGRPPTVNAEKSSEALLNEDQVARLLSLSVRTLQAWRVRGGGPAFVRCGRAIRYRPADVSRWMDARTVETKEGGSD